MKMGRIGWCLKDEKRGIWGSFSRMFDVRSHKKEFEIYVEYKNTILALFFVVNFESVKWMYRPYVRKVVLI